MPILNRPPVDTDNNDKHYKTLVQRQVRVEKNYDALRNYNSIPKGSTATVKRWQRTVDLWNKSRQRETKP